MSMNPSEVITQRREKIQELLIKGLKLKDIAQATGVTIRQVERDAKTIREKWTKRTQGHTLNEIMTEFQIKSEYRIRELWKIALSPDTKPMECVRALQALLNEDEETVRRLQMVGILPSKPAAVENKKTPQPIVVRWVGDERKSTEDNRESSQLGA